MGDLRDDHFPDPMVDALVIIMNDTTFFLVSTSIILLGTATLLGVASLSW